MGYAFISYSTKNQTSADAIRELFNRNGIETWMSAYDVPAGSNYPTDINRAIRLCSCFVLLLSKESQRSPWVEREVNSAISKGKQVIAVQLEDFALNDAFDLYLTNCNNTTVRVIDENDANMKNVLASVKSYTGITFLHDKKYEMSAEEEMCFEGDRRYNEKNYTEAIKWYRASAMLKNASAQCNLGICYEYGRGVEKNDAKAVEWYQKSAEQKNARAQNHLGNYYYRGDYLKQDYTEAVKWYRKAAKNDANAQCNLGNCYYYGNGVDKNMEEAIKWYRKAAKQDNARAQKHLGDCYAYGKGVDKNMEEAAKWYRKAAEQGYTPAQEALKRLEY